MKQSHAPMPVDYQPRRLWRLFIPIAILLLSGLACAAPSLSRNTPAPSTPQAPAATQAKTPVIQAATMVPQPGIQSAQPTPAQKFPPALVEVNPPPQSALAAGASPVFYFNQPMEKSSVEEAFKVKPGLSGKFEWLDAATLRFKPSRPVSAGTAWQVTINTSAKAANGLALSSPVQVSYPAAVPLRIAEQLPAPKASDVNPSSAVVVTFTRPVVALGAEAQTLPPAFTLVPVNKGRGEWLNTSTYIFYPQPALMGGESYTVHLNTGLASLDGAPLAADAATTWIFSTSSPQVVSITPSSEQAVLLDSAITLGFNQPMDPASVQAGFSLVPPTGGPVAGKFTWNSTQTELTFKPDALLQRGTAYTLTVSGQVHSQGGATPGKDYAAVLNTVPQFNVTQTQPAAGEALQAFSGYGNVNLTFSSPVAAGQDYNQLISINPPLASQSIFRDPQGFQIFISGYFQPSTSYTLTVSADLQDRWGAKLGNPFAFTFTSQPAEPALVIPVQMMRSGGGLFIPANETTISAQATNINQVTLTRGKISLQDFIQAETDGNGLANWSSKAQDTWPLALNPKPNVSETVNLPLTRDSSPLAPGLYFLNLDPQPTPQQFNNTAPMLLVVSPIQMVFKTSTRQAFVWAVKVPENTPLANTPVTILDSSASAVGSCTTDANGACQVDLPQHNEPYKGLFAVHGQPGDADFSLVASNWSGGVNPWDFNLPYEYEGYQPEIYVYTDRPIYRPGQTVNFRVIARAKNNGRYTSPALKTLTVDVVSPFDILTGHNQTLTSLRLALDPYGSAAGTYTLPADAAPGSYSLRVQEVEFNSTSFEVAEYRKPEIDLQVKFPQPDVLAGKDVQSQVTARYFFGAPGGNLTLHWSLLRSPGYLNLPDGFSAGKVDTSWLQPWSYPGLGGDQFVNEGQAQTGPDGTATITIPGQDLLDRLGTAAEDLQTLKLEVTLEDESGLPVSARAEMHLHPAPYAIGVRSEQWSGQVGKAMTYTVRTVDWQGSPLADKPLSAKFRKVVWVQRESQDPMMPPDLQPQYTDIGSTDFRTSQQGEARVAFTPSDPGTYLVEITGDQGAVTQSLAWVGGAGTAPWPNLAYQRLYLRSDAKSYQPGQTAHIFIPNPYSEGALALVTVERAKVMRSMVIPIQGASYDLQLPLGNDEAPNIYVSVTLLGQANQRPDFRMGMVALDVAPSAQLLQVSVASSSQQLQPGKDVTLSIKVKDMQGQPVQGEFSLALIDKAVLALADPNSPAIEQAFYGEQPLGVQNSLSLAVYAGRFVPNQPGRGGGGGGAAAAVAPLRSQFADTAYWNAAIQTDANGAAQVTVKLPDNLTTWRADVRGLSSDTRVGQAQADLVTTKPLLIRPVAPRFVVLGDHIQLAAVVNNNTQSALKTSVRLEVAGLSLDDPNQAVQAVDVPAGGRQQVRWWGTVQDVPSLDLAFSVETAAGQPTLSDAARPELNPVPVLRYTASQSFGTSGMLPDAGERTELVSLPRSFTPLGGKLQVELSPSLSAAVIDGLKVLDTYPQDFTEPVLSRLLPNLAADQALKDLKLDNTAQTRDFEAAINDSAARLIRLQNQDGGWGWAAGAPSDTYLSSYALLVLSRATQSGVFVDPQIVKNGQAYLTGKLPAPSEAMQSWEADRLAFGLFALQQSGSTDFILSPLYDLRDKLSPWGKAFLALALQAQTAGDPRAHTLISDLESSALRSSTGANWQDASPTWHNWSTPNFTTAVVAYAIARLDPTSSVLIDALRYLVLNRQPSGAWASSYESAWSLMALTEAMRATGDAQASYAFSARLNGSPVVDGKVDNLTQAANPVDGQVPLSKLNADAPNALVIQRGAGSGRLYYRAFLQVDRPVQDAPAVDRGLSLTRQYYRAGQDCRQQNCSPLDALTLADPQPVQVRLTLTVPQDLYYVVVEDYFPSGAEVLNPRLKTSQQNVTPAPDQQAGSPKPVPYDLANPFDQGWGWWLFSDPQVSTDHIRWVVDYLPAGTYELTYRLTPLLAGEFRVIPAHAWEYYFPDVEGSSKGQVLVIK